MFYLYLIKIMLACVLIFNTNTLMCNVKGEDIALPSSSSSSFSLSTSSSKQKWHMHNEKKNNEILKAIELLESYNLLDIVCDDKNKNNNIRVSVAGENDKKILDEDLSDRDDYHLIIIDLICVFCCVLTSCMAAAFTIGVLSINPFDLLVIERTDPSETTRKKASALMPVVERRHQLLVTLLILNALANEALPIFIERLVPDVVAIFLSVFIVLIFGDILPTAIFSGPNRIELASNFVPLMNLLMWLLTPIAWPIAALLDYCLGHRDSSYDRNELAALVRINYEQRRRLLEDDDLSTCFTNSFNNDIDVDVDMDENDEKRDRLLRTCSSSRFRDIGLNEVRMIEGVLNLKGMKVLDILKPIQDTFLLSDDLVLNKQEILNIYLTGYSRIPIYTNTSLSTDTNNHNNTSIMVDKTPRNFKQNITSIRGILLTKQLMIIESTDNKKLSTMPLQQPIIIHPSLSILKLINIFIDSQQQQSKQKITAFKGGHLAIVCNYPNIAIDAMNEGLPIPNNAQVLGIVTLEDVIEQLIQKEILDEKDFREQHVISHCRLLERSSSSASNLHL